MNHKNLLLILFLSFPVFPWGKVGHETIARIAEINLSPATMEKIKPLLAGKSLEEISTWADGSENHRNTGPWHYINLPVRKNVTANNISEYYPLNGHHPTDNVVSQINEDIKELRNSNASFQKKQTALKYLVHFIGDLHMPLHVGDDNDRGGNEKQVRYFSPTSESNRGHVTNLHSLWDNLIEIKAAEDPNELGKGLNGKITALEKRKWDTGTVEDWAIESYSVAKYSIYPGLPVGPVEDPIPLSRNYYSKMRPICDEQLEKAGVRLAFVLEEIFKGK